MSRYEQLKEKRKQLKAEMLAIKNRERAAERKLETRAKIIAGALLFRELKAGRFSGDSINQWLSNKSTRPKDKEVLEKYLKSLNTKVHQQAKPKQQPTAQEPGQTTEKKKGFFGSNS